MKTMNWKKEALAYFYLVLGSLLFALGDVLFVNPYLLAPGGTYGLSNVLNTVWPWKISLYALCMDIPLLIVGTLVLGPKFGFKTILSTFLIFGFTFLIETYIGYKPIIQNGIFENPELVNAEWLLVPHSENIYFAPDYFLNTLVAGGIYGLAIGLIFKSGATSGGSDIISMILHKYTKISLGTLVMIVDSCITLTTLIAFGQLRLPIYSILVIFIEGKIIDLVVDGFNSYKTAFIVTDKAEEVRNIIVKDINRGGTCFFGKGLYKGVDRKMIYVTLTRPELVKLQSLLSEVDPEAFVNVVSSTDILGKGFKPLSE
ncbi:MAG: YitT family protein [Lentimicrobiaceae bacterium]|nr:YitT family protein [Lentimicrobiaceae bacterium]